LNGGGELPLLIEPSSKDVDLAIWAGGCRERIEDDLSTHGGILFRGFPLAQVEEFRRAARGISDALLDYEERSSPRHSVGKKVYTSTDYPKNQPIFLHNENSYQHAWPMKIFFFCETEPEVGGATPLADVRKVHDRIDPEVREEFRRKGWMYIRNFGDGFGLDWRTVFQTEDPGQVEAYCRERGIDVEWRGGGRLRTRAVRPALVRHPRGGEWVWFNHATFFHVSTLTETLREVLLQEYDDEADLPANTYFGDGSPIPAEVLEHLRGVYADCTVAFPWQRGDLLLLDNMKVAHGREPYDGARRILVAMAESCSWDALSHADA
jgi:alpha-ketoglutarate-dependent taurine dioxygenase